MIRFRDAPQPTTIDGPSGANEDLEMPATPEAARVGVPVTELEHTQSDDARGRLRGVSRIPVAGEIERVVVVPDQQASEEAESGDAIYRRYAPELLKFATGLVGPWFSEDVVHDVIVRCLRAPTWGTVNDQRAYLYRAVLNASRSHHRASRHGKDCLQLAAAREQPASHEPELRPEVLAAVLTLSVRQRAVIVLTYWQDLAPSQVAERLQISEGSVRLSVII